MGNRRGCRRPRWRVGRWGVGALPLLQQISQAIGDGTVAGAGQTRGSGEDVARPPEIVEWRGAEAAR